MLPKINSARQGLTEYTAVQEALRLSLKVESYFFNYGECIGNWISICLQYHSLTKLNTISQSRMWILATSLLQRKVMAVIVPQGFFMFILTLMRSVLYKRDNRFCKTMQWRVSVVENLWIVCDALRRTLHHVVYDYLDNSWEINSVIKTMIVELI